MRPLRSQIRGLWVRRWRPCATRTTLHLAPLTPHRSRHRPSAPSPRLPCLWTSPPHGAGGHTAEVSAIGGTTEARSRPCRATTAVVWGPGGPLLLTRYAAPAKSWPNHDLSPDTESLNCYPGGSSCYYEFVVVLVLHEMTLCVAYFSSSFDSIEISSESISFSCSSAPKFFWVMIGSDFYARKHSFFLHT